MDQTKIIGMTIAVTDMHKMVAFYSKVFHLVFEEIEMYESKLSKTQIDAIELLFCPAEIARNTAKQNRHQLEFEVEDLDHTISLVKMNDGTVMGEPSKDSYFVQVGIKDPDNNSIVIKQVLGI
ncbi:VOC family protein [Ekhidna sp.]|uniref:VOC family protein n=1 Tax=Ekhidna sp. TaxID=2608089 RepID=UPI003B513207